ncbi:MAG: DUF853 domain-containing protein, partial [Glaciimonas sp.]|nr:DUF853 domain-containing protein [Glaciimonas sp.]
ILKTRTGGAPVTEGVATPTSSANGSSGGFWSNTLGGLLGTSGAKNKDTIVEAVVKSAARTAGSTLGRQIIRGVLGSIFKGK